MKYKIVANTQSDMMAFNRIFGTDYMNKTCVNPYEIIEATFDEWSDLWCCVVKFNIMRGSTCIKLIEDKE